MPPSKPLPPAILSALGLVSTGCGLLGPCLDVATCLDYVTYPSADTGKVGPCLDFAPTGVTATTGDTGTVGPCLDLAPTGQTGDTGAAPTSNPATAPGVPDKAELLEELSKKGTLPADVLEKLRPEEE